MEHSPYYIKRKITETPIPEKEWVFFVLKDGFKKIGILTDDKQYIVCVGKSRVRVSEAEYWLEEL